MIPKELRSRRVALGLSLDALALRADVSPIDLDRMERGDAPIHACVIEALAALEREAAGGPTHPPPDSV